MPIKIINPSELYSGVKRRDTKAEQELVEFIRSTYGPKYIDELGPLADDWLQVLSSAVIDAIQRDMIDHPNGLIPFCKQTAEHKRIDGVRAAGRAARRLISIDGRDFRSRDDVEKTLIWREQYQTVIALIKGLDPVSGDIIWRLCLKEQSMREVEKATGLTQEQIRGRKARAIEKLRNDYQAMNQQWRVIPGGRKPSGGLKAAA